MKDDIFDRLANNLRPSFNQFRELQQQMKRDIQRRIINSLNDARTMPELDRIIDLDEVFFIEWPELITHYESACKRVKHVLLAYKEIHGLEMLN